MAGSSAVAFGDGGADADGGAAGDADADGAVVEVVDPSAGWTFCGPGFSRGASPPRQANTRMKTTAVVATTLIVVGGYHAWRKTSGQDVDLAIGGAPHPLRDRYEVVLRETRGNSWQSA